MIEVVTCTFDRWRPVIGDPGWQGWTTVILYLVVAALALRVVRRARFPIRTRRRERAFWVFVTMLMMVLSINKQLDLQSAFTAAGRCLAQIQGWYGQRRGVQLLFLLGLAAMSSLVLLSGLVFLRHSLRRIILPALGLVFVCGFVLMRAVGFHNFDLMLGVPVFGVRANTALEWFGPLLISAGAVWCLKRGPGPLHAWRTSGAVKRCPGQGD